jgi:hypothetical protein
MKQHKHLRKIRLLLDVMYIWQQAGPTVTSDEMDDFQIALGKVEDIKELCQKEVNHKLKSHTLKEFNLYYKLYNTKKQWTTAN